LNEDKASRYHRLKRRATVVWALPYVAGLVALISAGGSGLLRDAVIAVTGAGPSAPSTVALYTVGLMIAYHVLLLPLAAYQGFILERRFGLRAASFSGWLLDFAKAAAVVTVPVAGAAVLVYTTIRWWPHEWWILSAVCVSAGLLGLARIFPVALLPLFYRIQPLDREALSIRFSALCERAGVPVIGVYAWGLGEKSHRANAALVGTGSTRRILLSDTLLADYSDDEIEIILAHEIGHHVHADIRTALLVEFARITLAFAFCALVLDAVWDSFGLMDPSDVAGLPILLVAGALVYLATGPALKAWSRRNERRADEFALAMTRQPSAFVTAMRRLSTQNLAEARPSRPALWFFHTHPPIEERIATARRFESIS